MHGYMLYKSFPEVARITSLDQHTAAEQDYMYSRSGPGRHDGPSSERHQRSAPGPRYRDEPAKGQASVPGDYAEDSDFEG